jgi:hypothetical protein
VIGLDGVVAQQQNYKKSGSSSLMPTSVTAARSRRPPRRGGDIIALSDVPLAAVEAYDATVFPAPRTAFLRAWIGAPGHIGCALMRDGGLAGWGVIRPCRKGRKIGPLVADDRATAEVVLSALLASVGGGEIFLDVPSINRDAVALAQDLGLAPVFETARMYTGAIRRCGWSGCSASPALSWGRGCLAPLFAGAPLDRSSVDPVARFVLRGVVAARRYSTYEKAGARLAFSSPIAATGRCGDG